MALSRQTEDGNFVEVDGSIKSIQPEFASVLNRLTRDGCLRAIHGYIASSITDQETFTVAKLFGGENKDWLTRAPALEQIHDSSGGNSEVAAIVLGIIVYQYMAKEALGTWYCTKTPMKDRDIQVLSYWREDSSRPRATFRNGIQFPGSTKELPCHRNQKSGGKPPKAA